MVEEFILNQLRDNDQKISKLEFAIKEYEKEEEESDQRLKEYDLQNQDNLGVFSPRMINDNFYKQKLQIEEQIEQIRLKKIQIREQIQELNKSNEQYQKMLLEKKTEETHFDQMSFQIMDESESIKLIKQQSVDEYKQILKRVDKITCLLDTNKNLCRNELSNLKYYIKALISSQMIDSSQMVETTSSNE